MLSGFCKLESYIFNKIFKLFFLHCSDFYCPYASYGQSKLAIILGTYELQKRLQDAELPVTVNCLHPGVVNTNLYRHLSSLMQPFKNLFAWIGLMKVIFDISIKSCSSVPVEVELIPQKIFRVFSQFILYYFWILHLNLKEIKSKGLSVSKLNFTKTGSNFTDQRVLREKQKYLKKGQYIMAKTNEKPKFWSWIKLQRHWDTDV